MSGSDTYDVVIVGAGPARLQAAIHASRKESVGAGAGQGEQAQSVQGPCGEHVWPVSMPPIMPRSSGHRARGRSIGWFRDRWRRHIQ